ncbi:MAG: Holliday junction branch migration protein RuvA [Bacteroidota bacterium]|jgi:Holliday junction DNA helicase RuvA|nr:Holliday junction branch migration protein RuvA [Chitinophagaceae bacterium]
MIAFLEGTFIHQSPANIIVNVNGVGYDVNISLYTFGKIQNLSKGRLLIYLRISENEHSLFGFYDDAEKNLFLHLISVSGVGASTARVMLSGAAPAELANAIALGDEKTLERVKGIGAKTAKRIILELKDKVGKSDIVMEGFSSLPQNNLQNDALNALVSLGIAKNTAAEAVRKALKVMPEMQDVQELIKQALKNI